MRHSPFSSGRRNRRRIFPSPIISSCTFFVVTAIGVIMLRRLPLAAASRASSLQDALRHASSVPSNPASSGAGGGIGNSSTIILTSSSSSAAPGVPAHRIPRRHPPCAFVGCAAASGRTNQRGRSVQQVATSREHHTSRQAPSQQAPACIFTPKFGQVGISRLNTNTMLLATARRTAATKTTSTKPNARPYKLVIVESPSKAKTIAAILNAFATKHNFPYTYLVDSCLGHVRDLPMSAKQLKDLDLNLNSDVADVVEAAKKSRVLGVDVNNEYEPLYIVPDAKVKTVKRLRGMVKDKDCVGVILATDEDREGEAIAWHLREMLGRLGGGDANEEDAKEMTRVTFNEITESAITRAFFGEHATDATTPSEPTEAGHDIDMDLVSAQETRRVLDRLAGYTVSPLLWKKIAPGLSAGRVQSVGLKLVVDRERERMRHISSEYWDARANLCVEGSTGGAGGGDTDGANGNVINDCFNATLVAIDGVRVASGKDFDGETGQLVFGLKDGSVVHLGEEMARQLFDANPDGATWTVTSVESKSRSNTGPVPFITSTLQQDSNRRLGLSVSDTMRAAQMLYEEGYISYMRTDSTHLSNDALGAGKAAVTEGYGADYLAEEDPNARASRRKSKKKGKQDANKNAQEAHEAIRPSIQQGGRFLAPKEVPAHYKEKSGGAMLPDRALKLYELIYSRTTASFMKDQVLDQTSVMIDRTDEDITATFRASGSVVVFPGFAAAYGGGGGDSLLPPLADGQLLDCSVVEPLEHHTKPPPRYNEASFVKELEALGVGRPSTYASVVQTLRQRAYIGTPLKGDESARSKPKAVSGPALIAQRAAGGDEFVGSGRGPLCPSLSAFVVCTLLEKHFPSYVDPTFTADMEGKLDSIASGNKEEVTRVQYLEDYYGGENGLAAQVDRVDKVVDASEARRADLPGLLTKNNDGEDDVGLFIGPWGAYIQRLGASDSADGTKPPTANLPQGMAADLSTITPEVLNALLAAKEKDGILLGQHPKDGRNIRLKIGRYGAYLQWGDAGEEGTTNHSLPRDVGGLGGRNINLAGAATLGITLEDAVGYTGLPRTVCELHDIPILASIGPYGPYLKYNNTFVSLKKEDGDVLTVDDDTAKRIVTEGIINKPDRLARGVLAELGEKDGSMVRVKDGRFGVYINWKHVNAKMPAEYYENPDDLPLEEAWSLIEAKAGSTSGKSGRGKKSGKSNSIDLPPAPKRPLSAYLHFCAEMRPHVAESAGSLGEVSKALAAMWADCDDRKKYDDLAAAGKADYEEKKKAWQEECDKVMSDAGLSKASRLKSVKKAKGQGQDNGIKRPLSAYLHFCATKRPEVAKEGMALGEVSKELARLWAETAEGDGDERKQYQDMAAADKERYEKELAELGSSRATAKAKPTSRRKATTKRTTKAKAKAKIPRAPSAYMMFCSDNRQNVSKEDGSKPTFGETTKLLAAMWKEIDDNTRSEYQQRAAKEKEKLMASQ